MPSLKAIRKRISSVKSTQKITRAMKMVAAARLRRAQQRIVELRPFALRTAAMLRDVALRTEPGEVPHPLLERRPEQRVLLLVIGGDRGLAGAFNANIHRNAERTLRELRAEDKEVALVTFGRRPRDYFRRRQIEPILELPGPSEKLDVGAANRMAAQILDRFVGATAEGEGASSAKPFDAVYVVYNEFKSAMTQRVVVERLLPVEPAELPANESVQDFVYEPDRAGLLQRLLPMYVQTSLFRGLLESVASEHGARMTAMEAATDNAKELIAKLTLDYNRARQAAITKELMEIIGGAEALK